MRQSPLPTPRASGTPGCGPPHHNRYRSQEPRCRFPWASFGQPFGRKGTDVIQMAPARVAGREGVQSEGRGGTAAVLLHRHHHRELLGSLAPMGQVRLRRSAWPALMSSRTSSSGEWGGRMPVRSSGYQVEGPTEGFEVSSIRWELSRMFAELAGQILRPICSCRCRDVFADDPRMPCGYPQQRHRRPFRLSAAS
jgi:hypothetical protein